GYALPQIAGAAHLVGNPQPVQGRLQSQTNRAGAIQDRDLLGGMAALEQLCDRPSHLPRLDLRRLVAADDNLAGVGNGWLIVLVATRAIVADQPLGGRDDLRCRAIIAVETMNLRASILLRKVQDKANVRRAE